MIFLIYFQLCNNQNQDVDICYNKNKSCNIKINTKQINREAINHSYTKMQIQHPNMKTASHPTIIQSQYPQLTNLNCPSLKPIFLTHHQSRTNPISNQSHLSNSIIKIEQLQFSLKQNLNHKCDFIKRFRLFNERAQSNITAYKQNDIVLIYENQFVVRLIKAETRTEQINVDKNQMNQESIQTQNNKNKRVKAKGRNHFNDVFFESVPYDALFLSSSISSSYSSPTFLSKNLITSNRGMPVRIYSIPCQSQHVSNYTNCTFNDHKPNSQAFLSPFQFSAKNNTVVGVGRKFLNIYDCQKMKTNRLKAFDKVHLSTVQVLNNQKIALVGDFIGNIYQIDLRQYTHNLKNSSFKPHLDAVFHTKSFDTNQNLFLSSARKDNFTYLFDRRKLSTFVNFFEFERYSNQRYGIALKNDYFAIGQQNGSIYLNNINSSPSDIIKTEYLFQDQKHINISDLCISQVTNQNIEILFSCGTRSYPDQLSSEQSKIQSDQNFALKSFTLNLQTKLVQ